MKSNLKIIFVFTAVVLMSVSCSKKYTEDELKQIVSETDKKLNNLAGQQYEWGSKKAYSTVMAYYPEDDIIFLNENLKYRKRGQAFNLYYYKDGNLFRFIGKKLIYKKGNKRRFSKELIHINMFLQPDGELVSYEKTINYNDSKLTDDELNEILNHAEELYKLVGDQPSD